MKSLLRLLRAGALTALLSATAVTTQAAGSTWNGTTSLAWTNAANWSPGIPATGEDVIIADTTGSGNVLNLTDSRTIGSLTFGTTGTRATQFAISNSVAANSLTLSSGLTASTAAAMINLFKVPTIIGADQTWSIGGTPGAVTADFGIGVVPRANGTQTPFNLVGNLTKTGSGQLTFIGANITNNGNFTINQGVVKLNGGSSTPVSVSGGGSIIINSGAKLMLFRNSGAVTCTKAITLNAGGTLEFGGNTAAGATYAFPLTMSGNVNFSSGGGATAGQTNRITGPWTGTASVNGTAVGANVVILVLSNDISGWTGSFNNAGNAFRIGFSSATPGNAAVAWSLNNAGAVLEGWGATNILLGSLGGNSGTLRNSHPTAQAATVTVGALNTDTTFGGILADNGGTLGLIKVGSGALTLTGANTYSGGTEVRNGSLLLQGTAATTGSGAVAVKSGAAFGGSGTLYGAVNVEAGGRIIANGGTGAPALSVGPLTLGLGGSDASTTTVNVYLGGKVVAISGLTLNGQNTINITGAAPAVGTYDLIQHSGFIGGAGYAGFKLGTLPYGVEAHLQNGATAVQLVVTAITIEPSVWVGNATGTWNLTGTLDWKGATSGNPQPYHDLDVTSFDDSAASFTVSVATNVTPAVMTVSAAAHDYTFTGAGDIIGPAALFKTGAGTLTIANSNTFSGGIFVTNGTLQLGNGGTNGYVASPIEDNTALVLNRSDAFTVPGVISGTGTVEQKGSGFSTLGNANTYLGVTTVSAGTLLAGNGACFGDTNAGVNVALGATLDVNVQNLGMEPITAQGAGVGSGGAIVNNGTADQQNALRYVTLAGDTTFGGVRRWDIRNPSSATDPTGGGHAFLHANGFNLTKVGSNTIAMINVGDTALADIEIQAGTLTISRSTIIGKAAKKAVIWPGATLQLHRLNEFMFNPLDKVLLMTNATLAIEANGLTNTFAGPVSLYGTSNVVSVPGPTNGLVLSGPINGPSSLNVVGPGPLILTGNANHVGGTTLNGSVLQVDGTLGAGAAITFMTNATLAGNGTVAGPVTIPAGSLLAPGANLGECGTLTIGGALTLAAGSTSRMEITKDSLTNDRVNVTASITYGGTLLATNVGYTSFAPGDSFKLFNASSYSGGFSSIVPAAPALGLMWDTNYLKMDGTLRVMVVPTPRPLIALSASSLLSNTVNVVFDTEVDYTAEDPNNYTLSTGNKVIGATKTWPAWPGTPVTWSSNVLLTLETPLAAKTFTVNVKNVRDMAYVPNVVVTTNVPGIGWGFRDSVPVLVTNGSAFAYADKIKIYADGSDIFGTADHFQYVFDEFTGDFDMSVCLESFLITDPAAKAGIMAREINDATAPLGGDRHFLSGAFTPDATRNNNYVQYREETDGNAVAPAAPRPGATYPTNWLRLKRTGAILQGFCGPNGLDWTPMSAVDSATNTAGAYPATIRLGLAVTSHNAAATTEAVFHHWDKAKERPALTVSQSGTDVILTWPASGLGWTLQASPSVTAPDMNWTNVPGTAAITTKTLPIGPGNLFFRLIQ